MRNLVERSVLTIFLSCLAASSALGDDWSQWRGPNRDGISQESGLLASWPPGGPQEVWRVDLGEGYSCMSVSEGRVFTMFQRDGSQWLIALDEKTGDRLWRIRMGPAYDNKNGSGPRSTPTVEGTRVYAFDALGDLVCADTATGKEIWRCQTLTEFGAKNLAWAVSMSPLVDGEKLLANVGESNGSSIVAFDKNNGKVIWKALDDMAGYSSPMEHKMGDKREIVFFAGTGALGLNPENGELLWRFPWKTSYDVHSATPILQDDLVFISSAYDVGCALLRIDLDAAPDARVKEVWRSRVMRSHFGTPILVDGYLYGFDNGTFRCVEFMTGESKWELKGFQKGSLVIAGGMSCVLGERGRLALAKLTPEACEIVSEVEGLVGPKCWTMPVVANGRLYIRDESKLLCLDVKAP
ncbi:PQQ-like beta-propeller repeat protein [Candidatus Sumerlaeota bacterium]|nr:PQQ-like beta-propeller repeat protein [Candidatus Sumerlaeota bacterium]